MEIYPPPVPSSLLESSHPRVRAWPGRQAAPRRDLGAGGAASVVVSLMICTGIVLMPRSMALKASPRVVVGVRVACGLRTLAGLLAYAELASALPETGSCLSGSETSVPETALMTAEAAAKEDPGSYPTESPPDSTSSPKGSAECRKSNCLARTMRDPFGLSTS